MDNELCNRLLLFTTSVLKYIQKNRMHADFYNKIHIALKEIRESYYWLMCLKSISAEKQPELEKLILEAEELKKILGAIASKTSQNLKK